MRTPEAPLGFPTLPQSARSPMLKGDATKTHRANSAHVCLRHFQFVDFVMVVSGNLGTAFRIRRQSGQFETFDIGAEIVDNLKHLLSAKVADDFDLSKSFYVR
jgi:hypothetical protein